jgi:hypothetical protein
MISPWMEQRHDLSGDRIDSREIRSLVGIAEVASESQVLRQIAPTMLPGDDMFDMKPNSRPKALTGAAILTAVSGTASHQFARGRIHQAAW